MRFTVEPQTGHDLDRLITALLNATGVVRRVIDSTEYPRDADGAEAIGLVAERLRGVLSLLTEHRSDADLDLATQVLAETTLLLANHFGLGGLFAGES